jgi:hypothetical protein
MLDTIAKKGTRIAVPAQLLPLIVGALSFVRVCWLIFAEKSEERRRRRREAREAAARTAGDECEAEGWDTATTPTNAAMSTAVSTASKRPALNRWSTASSSVGLGIRHFFSPNLGRPTPMTPAATPNTDVFDEHEHGHAESHAGYHPWHRRYVVAWLPWLSLFEFWHNPHGSDGEEHGDVESSSPLANIETEDTGASADVKEKMEVQTVEEVTVVVVEEEENDDVITGE